ncbi:MAG: ATP-binding protein [Lachnospiraceae bacterium]|nr:ATP-binding protein [Lachnospiraceae bacterium]
MALTNQQFVSIMRDYELVQNRNRRHLEERENEIYENIPEYRKLAESTGALAKACAKNLLDGEEQAIVVLKNKLADLSRQKKALLKQHGYSESYLEPIYNCTLCRDTGYLYQTEKPDVREKCRCFRQKEIALLYEQSNIQKTIEKENFSTLSFEYYEGEDRKRFQEAVRICLDFVQNFEQDYQNLFFYGTVGTGKSFLSGCIARELLQSGHSVIYFSSAGLFDTLARYTFDATAKEALYNFYKDLYNCDLVIIDDLGTEVTNSFVTSQLFGCLNERYLRRKATIISTNLSLEELRDRYSDRIFSRITSNFTICKLSGPDIRIYKKRMHK